MTTNIHACCVAVENDGVMIVGGSGRGKSDLCLRLIKSHHAILVADDRVDLYLEDEQVFASAPAAIKGCLEVRGVGILTLPALDQVIVKLVVELVREPSEVERLPEPGYYDCGGIKIRKIRLYPFEASAPDKIIAALRLLKSLPSGT